jgi:tetratricopeptide (TPR) repeat protein
MGPSVFGRLWNALKPPPAVRPRWRPTPTQKVLLIATFSVLAAAGVAGGVWAYNAGAPDRAQLQFELGMRQMGAGAYRAALASFDRSIATWPNTSPNNATAFYNRGMAHRLLGETDAALADFSQAIAERADYGEAYTERGALAQTRGDAAQAMQDFSRAVELTPSANGYFQRGEAYALLGQPQKALEDFDRAIRERPDAPYIYRARAAVKKTMGDLDGYAADRDQSVKTESAGFPPAWVDTPLSGGALSGALPGTVPGTLPGTFPGAAGTATAGPRNSPGGLVPSPRAAPPSR